MQFRKFIKLALATAVGLTALQSMTAVAQEIRSEISVQGTGFFTKDSDGDGVQNHVTNTVGFLIAYRYSINRWLAAEANYGYDRNTQIYFSSGFGSLQSNVHQVNGEAVVKLPTIIRLQPYAPAGAASLFDPTGNAGGTFTGATWQAKGAFVYDAGADYAFTKRISLRVECRDYLYKAPDLNLASSNTNPWTHTAQASAGIVFRFYRVRRRGEVEGGFGGTSVSPLLASGCAIALPSLMKSSTNSRKRRARVHPREANGP